MTMAKATIIASEHIKSLRHIIQGLTRLSLDMTDRREVVEIDRILENTFSRIRRIATPEQIVADAAKGLRDIIDEEGADPVDIANARIALALLDQAPKAMHPRIYRYGKSR